MIIIMLLIAVVVNSNLMVANAGVDPRSIILDYENRVNQLNTDFVNTLPRINNYLSAHKNVLKEISDKELIITFVEKIEANRFDDSIDLIINQLNGEAKTSLQSLKTDLISLMDKTMDLESDLRIYINDNITDLTFTDLFPITNAINSLYQVNKGSIKSFGSYIKEIAKENLSINWNDYEEYEITEFINNLFNYADDIKDNLSTYRKLDSKINNWINIINVLELDDILLITNLKTDLDSLKDRVSNIFELRINKYFEALNNRLINTVNDILNSEDTIINKNTRISDIIDIYDGEIERINTKYNEVLTYTEVTKIENILADFRIILLEKMNDVIDFLISKLQASEIDIVNKNDNDLDNIIDYNDYYFITKKLYTLTNINLAIKINNITGYILYTNIQNGKIATNSNLNIYNNNDELVKTYKVIVKGDVVANGLFNINDVRLINAHILRQRALANIYYEAADLTDDGVINVNDARMLNQKIIDGA